MHPMQRNLIATVACLGLGAVPLAAQEPSPSPPPAGAEHHHAVAAHHANAMQHAKALHHHAHTSKTVNKEVAKEHAEEMGRSVDAAEKHTEALEKSMSESEKKAHAANLKSIHEHHAQAKEHHEALNKELAKEQPEPAKVKEHSARIYHHVSAAHASHTAVMKQRKVREASPPPSPMSSPSPQ
jgi:hypothetical protein